MKNRLTFYCLSLLALALTSSCTLTVRTKPPGQSSKASVSSPSEILYVSSPTGTPILPTETPSPTATSTSMATSTLTLQPPQPFSVSNSTNTPTPLVTSNLTMPEQMPSLTPTPPVAPSVQETTNISVSPIHVVTPTLPVEAPPISSDSLSVSNYPIVYETTIAINTYDYQSALLPTSSDDPVFPYPRLNHDRVGLPSLKEYRAIILENQYLQLTVLPELGGRIYRWVDKATGVNLFYENPVIKPTHWGHRGWWLATGGMEWALPLDEHGLSETSPWEYSIYHTSDVAGVLLSDIEDHTALVSEINISLDADHTYFTLVPRISNPTDHPINFKFWLNGMFSLGSNSPQMDVKFILPSSHAMIHSTGDQTLPGERGVIDWPIFQGRDLSQYETWTDYLGVFAAPSAQADFMGAYNHRTNLGVVRIFPSQLVRGAKIFGPGNLDPSLWTIDKGSYFELWGGLAPTFWDEVTLNSGEWITWQEYWYDINDMGSFRFANDEIALNLEVTDTSAQVAANSTHPTQGELILSRNGQAMANWPVSLTPQHAFRGDIPTSSSRDDNWTLAFVDALGQEIARLNQDGPSGNTLSSASDPPDPVATVTPTPILTDSIPPDTDLIWDARLDSLAIQLTPGQPEMGRPIYHLTKALYQDDSESALLHHIFVEVLDENGQRLVGQPIIVTWKDGQTTLMTENKPEPEYAANFPMYSALNEGTYQVYVDGAPSDVISGLGLPGNHHVNYLLTFKKDTSVSVRTQK